MGHNDGMIYLLGLGTVDFSSLTRFNHSILKVALSDFVKRF